MKIAIAGYGVEGKANYNYWSRDPANQLTIVDETTEPNFTVPAGAQTLLGPGVFGRLQDFDMVIRTAGLPPRNIVTNGRIWSGTNEFFAHCPAPIIGVTGSKGKGTTSSLIASILNAAGKKVWLVGNIGEPSLNMLPQITQNDIVVYELSSFQLWDIERSPQTAVVLFIEQEHLDVHVDMTEYVAAKGNIGRFQSPDDLMIYDTENHYARAIANLSPAILIGYPSTQTAHVKDGFFWNGEQKLCSVERLSIKGQHNVQNAIAAIDAVWRYTQDSEAIAEGLFRFMGLPHRLAYVASVDGVDYYDDSIATTPGSAMAALRAFSGPKTIILGGSSKGADFRELAKEMKRHDVNALLIGDESNRLAEAFAAAGFDNYEVVPFTTMEALVARARQKAVMGSVVLLSPAAASFGLFQNYIDRGNQFIDAVKQLQ